jgi:hypothetical protein
VGVIGMHKEGMPCEKITLNSTKSLLASISHSDSITVWNIDSPEKEEDKEQEGSDGSDSDDEETVVLPEKKKRRKLKNKLVGSADKLVNQDFFADLD